MADAIITKDPENVKEVFSFGYAKLFDQQWPMWVGGLLLGVLNVFMFAFEKAWSVADCVRNCGNWFINTINVLEITIIDPHLYSTSLLNFGIIVGALASALLAKQFQVRNAPTRELSQQSQDILEVAGKSCCIRSVSGYGGVSKFFQRECLGANGATPYEVVVATPGEFYIIANVVIFKE